MLDKPDILRIIKFCSEEVKRQGRGPTEVGNMVEAWIDALSNDDPLVTSRIIGWGWWIEPTVNSQVRFRNVDVRVGYHIAPDYSKVTSLMHRFVDNLDGMSAEEAYFEFEYIHPFADGNGRVGKIIYNWKLGTLLDPQWPPNKWGITNP